MDDEFQTLLDGLLGDPASMPSLTAPSVQTGQQGGGGGGPLLSAVPPAAWIMESGGGGGGGGGAAAGSGGGISLGAIRKCAVPPEEGTDLSSPLEFARNAMLHSRISSTPVPNA